MRCWKKSLKALIWILVVLTSVPSVAGDSWWSGLWGGVKPQLNHEDVGYIRVSSLKLEQISEGFFIIGQYDVHLSSSLQETLLHGVVLHFDVSEEVWQVRHLWWDREWSTQIQDRWLSYNPLTEEFIVRMGSIVQSFGQESDALTALGTILHLPVASAQELSPGGVYQVRLQMRLDSDKLPQPLQADSLSSNGWKLEAPLWQVRFKS